MNSEAENKSNLACKCVIVKSSLCRLLRPISNGNRSNLMLCSTVSIHVMYVTEPEEN